MAIPDSDVSRTVARVPSRSGAYGSSTAILTAAWLSSVRLMPVTRADAAAADLHVVVHHQLARVLEQERVLGPAGAAQEEQPAGQHDDEGERDQRRAAGDRPAHSIPSGPCDAPARNWRTNWLSESNSSAAGPDSTIRPRHSTAMYSATRLADMMSWVITT